MKLRSYIFIGTIFHALQSFSMESHSEVLVFKVVNPSKEIEQNKEVVELKQLLIEKLASVHIDELKEINILYVPSSGGVLIGDCGMQVNFIYEGKRNYELEDKLSEIIKEIKNNNGTEFMLERSHPITQCSYRYKKGWEQIWPK